MKYCTYCNCERPYYLQQEDTDAPLIKHCAYCRSVLSGSTGTSDNDGRPFEEIQKINPPSDRLKEGNVV